MNKEYLLGPSVAPTLPQQPAEIQSGIERWNISRPKISSKQGIGLLNRRKSRSLTILGKIFAQPGGTPPILGSPPSKSLPKRARNSPPLYIRHSLRRFPPNPGQIPRYIVISLFVCDFNSSRGKLSSKPVYRLTHDRRNQAGL